MAIISDFRIVKELSARRTGVCLAESVSTSQSLVIKQNSSNLVLREYNALKACSGPLIQEVHSISDDFSFLVLQYYSESRTLLSLDDSELDLAYDALLKLIEAVEWCHCCGYVHGDIKPSNLLLLPNKDIRLIDFGSALPLGTKYSNLDSFEYTPKKLNNLYFNEFDHTSFCVSTERAIFDNDWECLVYYAYMLIKHRGEIADKLIQKIDKIRQKESIS